MGHLNLTPPRSGLKMTESMVTFMTHLGFIYLSPLRRALSKQMLRREDSGEGREMMDCEIENKLAGGVTAVGGASLLFSLSHSSM